MKRKSLFLFLLIVSSLIISYGCGIRQSNKSETIVIPGGTVSPTLGMGFDVNYDPELDNVISGYKILTVAYTNNSMNIIQMDPVNDKWIVTTREGKEKKAIINLRDEDPDVWAKLPRKIKVLIEYPLLIPIGSTQTIDLIFPQKVNLNEFKSVIFQGGKSPNKIKILPRES